MWAPLGAVYNGLSIRFYLLYNFGMETFTGFLSQPQVVPFLKVAPWVVGLLLVWSLVWKGMALWKAARLSSKAWFVILLIVNTFGILEIIYIFAVAKKKEVVPQRTETNM
jgi:hypothetical protein